MSDEKSDDDLVREAFPMLPEEQVEEARVNLDTYFTLAYRIFRRLEDEGRIDEIRAARAKLRFESSKGSTLNVKISD
jgi:hypothetical protein